MSRLVGKWGDLYVGDTSGNLKRVAGIRNWTLNTTAGLLDKTGMDSAGSQEFVAGMTGWTVSFQGHYDSEELASAAVPSGHTDGISQGGHFYGPAASNTQLILPGRSMYVKLVVQRESPDAGTHTPLKWYEGNVIVTGFNVEAAVDADIDFSCECQGTGALTYPQ